jgi:hypothetical protein
MGLGWLLGLWALLAGSPPEDVLAGYRARELLRSDGLVLRWGRPEDEVLVFLLPPRVAEVRHRLEDLLGVQPSQPSEVVLAATLDDQAALAGLPRESVEALHLTGLVRADRLLLLSPTEVRGESDWSERLAGEWTRHTLAVRYTPDLPAWLREGVVALVDQRFERPGARRWALPPREVAAGFFRAPGSEQAGDYRSRVDVAILGWLTVRAVTREAGPAGLRALVESRGTALPGARLSELLTRQWQREAASPSSAFVERPPNGPREPVERARALAGMLLRKGHRGAAARQLHKAWALTREVPDGLALLPLAVQVGDWKTAGDLCAGLPAGAAEGFLYRFSCGQLRQARQEYPAAVGELERAADFQPYSVELHRALLEGYDALKQSREKLMESQILTILGADPG